VDVSIIIVNWNSADYLKKCVASILAHTRGISFEIIVIDSASFDGCDRMLREYYPDVRFIQSRTNVGFARANNLAFEQSVGQYVLFLNPDTELLGPVVQALHAQLRSDPHGGVAGCRLLNSDGSLQTSCVQAIPTLLNQVLDAEPLRAAWPNSRLWGTAALFAEERGPHEVEAISGACVMVERGTFESVGKFDEDYFMYSEDIDLSHRIRATGRRNVYIPDVAVIHYGGNSSQQAGSSFTAVMMREALRRFFRKTRGASYATAYRVSMGAAALVRLGILLAAAPLAVDGATATRRSGSFQKWLAVLRWSLGRDGVVARYYTHAEQRARQAAA
jgi:N-acetylglucosaminyl-diphospho-decaprenol L-rhamnosyltransferase